VDACKDEIDWVCGHVLFDIWALGEEGIRHWIHADGGLRERASQMLLLTVEGVDYLLNRLPYSPCTIYLLDVLWYYIAVFCASILG